jgi:hypothetical protein
VCFDTLLLLLLLLVMVMSVTLPASSLPITTGCCTQCAIQVV